MKLRIQDSSVRFRITLKELEQLSALGALTRETRLPGQNQHPPVFTYGVQVDPDLEASMLSIEPFNFLLMLSAADLHELESEEHEGVYVRNEWQDSAGNKQRFMCFIEKDRPSSKCDKPEAWIYDEVPGKVRNVRAIPTKKATA